MSMADNKDTKHDDTVGKKQIKIIFVIDNLIYNKIKIYKLSKKKYK